MSCTILIFLWVEDELSYDRFHENVNELYRIGTKSIEQDKMSLSALTPIPLRNVLKDEYPEIIRATRFSPEGNNLVKYGENVFSNNIVSIADPDFFTMFSFPFLKGSAETAFSDKYSVIITEEMSNKYFGKDDPIGKVLNIDNRDFTVTAVLKTIPKNSHFQFDAISPFISRSEYIKKYLPDDSWRHSAYYTYVQLQKRAKAEEVNNKIADLIKLNNPESAGILFLQPVTKIHLHHEIEDYLEGQGDIKYIYMFSALAFLILLIACINFINLSTARYEKRAKEVGLRKVSGAHRVQIIKQFLGESLIFSFVALVLALILTELFRPAFNNLAGKELIIKYSDIKFVAGILIITGFTGFASGSYPALFLSSFSVIHTLKGTLFPGNSSRKIYLFRRMLVIIQFTLSIFLILTTAFIFKQLNYIQNKELGFEKENLIYFRNRGDFNKSFEIIKNKLKQNPDIIGVNKGNPPLSSNFGILTDWEGKETDEETIMNYMSVDFNYIENMRIEMIQGRSFSRDFSSDSSAYIINEEALKMMGVNSPVGKQFSHTDPFNRIKEGQIIGVIKNFHYNSLHNLVTPLVLRIDPEWQYYVCVRIKSGKQDVTGIISYLKNVWEQAVPGRPFEYEFLDTSIDNFYRNEQRIGNISKYSTILALIVACLGVLGLAIFISEQRTKEIGIRKVFGASVSGIIILLSKELAKWVLIANIIAWPIAYAFMKKWMQNFAYKTDLSWWIFIIAGIITLLIAVFTVSFQTIKAANKAPVDTLRYE